jgi:hypothetical protein
MAPSSVVLSDFTELARDCRENGGGLRQFVEAGSVAGLGWPEDVVEQWLYDHSGYSPFLIDYERLDLSSVSWREESIPVGQFLTMQTGDSEADLIEELSQNPEYRSEVRRPQGVPQHWESHGTWLRRPVLIDRALLAPPAQGLQVIEGRTRVAVLRGFVQRGRSVASSHAAWVARAR